MATKRARKGKKTTPKLILLRAQIGHFQFWVKENT